MKKYFFHLLILIPVCANAQSLVDTNKVWNVATCLNFGECGTTVFSFHGDTIIGAYQYKKLVMNSDSGGFGGIFPNSAREDTAARQVFFRYLNQECMAYDFSLNAGDTFSGSLNGCAYQLYVDSVDTVILLNGEHRKRMLLHSWWSETWIEGIGSSMGLTYSGFYNCSADIYPELICFKENDTLKYQDPSYTDCFYNTLSAPDAEWKNKWTLYPNPFNDFATLSFDRFDLNDGTLNISDPEGRLIKTLHNLDGKQLKIDCHDLPDGFYFFQLISKQKTIATGKLLVH